MKLKVSNEQLKHFSKPVKTAERSGSWLGWLTVCYTFLGKFSLRTLNKKGGKKK